MFDGLKGLTQIASLMRDAPRLKARFEEARERLRDLRVSAETGGGAVRATVAGDLRVTRVEIDPAMLGALIDPAAAEDRLIAEELIAGAVNAALGKARSAAESELQSAAGDLGFPLPPGGLGGLL